MNFSLSQYPSGCQALFSVPQADPNLLKLSFTRLGWDSGLSSAWPKHLGNSLLRAQLQGLHVTVTSPAQARRLLSRACRDCGDISHRRRNGNKTSRLESGRLCCCVRPRGCHPLRRASKTESVIAPYLSSVTIFVVPLSAGEGDDAGRAKIGR